MTKRNRRSKPDLELRVTIDCLVITGPIQAILLEAIRSTGSISAVHRALGKSHAHVWKLVATMRCSTHRLWVRFATVLRVVVRS